jgi:outer membrane protein
MGQSRRRLVVAALGIFLGGEVAAQQPDPEIQRAFIEGAQRLQAGDFEGAARIFRALVHKTDSPRVKLELARTLFYLEEYRESRELFKSVMLDSELPWRVRDNIDVFLRAIDDIQGYVRFSASLVSDSNPRNITSERQFTIGGLRLTFEPPEDNKRVTGLRYSVQAHQPLARQIGLSGYFTGSYLDYPASSLDRLTIDTGLSKRLVSAYGSVRAGLEAGTFGGKRLYQFPYLELGQRLSQSPVHRIDGALKAGRVDFPDFDHLDANYASASLSAAKSVSQTLVASMAGTLEVSDARERPYSYYGATIEPGMSLLAERPAAVLLKASLPFGYRQYGAEDPLFGARRRDRRIGLELSVRNKEWRWMNFTPAVVLALERNESNIDFYSYRKANFSVVLE